MHLLITPAEVIDTAFSPTDQIDNNTVNEFRIEAAQLKFLAPELGQLYTALTEGKYPDFCEIHIKPALAYFVKYSVLLNLSVRIGNRGITRNRTADSSVASDAEIGMLRKESRETASSLLEQALAFVARHLDEFPEYNREESERKRIRINGGLII